MSKKFSKKTFVPEITVAVFQAGNKVLVFDFNDFAVAIVRSECDDELMFNVFLNDCYLSEDGCSMFMKFFQKKFKYKNKKKCECYVLSAMRVNKIRQMFSRMATVPKRYLWDEINLHFHKELKDFGCVPK